MSDLLYIYGLPFHCMLQDFLVEHKKVWYNDKNDNDKLSNINIFIIALDKHYSIRNYTDRLVTAKKTFINKLCRFYVCAYQHLTKEQINSVCDEITKMKKEYNWSHFNKKSNVTKYTFKYLYPTIKEAINSVSRIYLHFGHYIKHNYIFINSTSNDGSLESNEDIIEYIHFDKRNQCVGTLHGKVNFNNSVDVFDFYPLTDNIPKVFILNENWQILSKCGNKSKNKIAIRVYGNLVFWLLTRYNSFIMHEDFGEVGEKDEQLLPSCSTIDTNSLTREQIQFISRIFTQVEGFVDLQFTQQSIYSVDTINNLFMFTGIMKEKQMGIFANLFDDFY